MINSAKFFLDTYSEVRDYLVCFEQNRAWCLQAVLEQKVNDLHSNQIKLKYSGECAGDECLNQIIIYVFLIQIRF